VVCRPADSVVSHCLSSMVGAPDEANRAARLMLGVRMMVWDE